MIAQITLADFWLPLLVYVGLTATGAGVVLAAVLVYYFGHIIFTQGVRWLVAYLAAEKLKNI